MLIVKHRCGSASLPLDVIDVLRTTLEQATCTNELASVEALRDVLGSVVSDAHTLRIDQRAIC